MKPDELASSRAIAESLVVNPFFAVELDHGLFGEHDPVVSETQWIRANRKLLLDIGAEAYLRRLLQVLKGEDPATLQQESLAQDIENLFGTD